MPGTGTLSLDMISVVLVWTAIAVYALAFAAYAVDLSRRGQLAVDAKDAARARTSELVGAGGGRSIESPAELQEQERAAAA